jgi:predicted nucleic acid-binding protein
MRLCLDTNAYSALMRNRSGIQHCLEEAELIHIPTIVLGELHAGFNLGSRYASRPIGVLLNAMDI